MNNTKSRKYQLTINNPADFQLNHDTINSIMQSIKWEYYCLCDEIGEQGTPHIHLFFVVKNAIRFSTVKKLFPSAHIEKVNGTCQQNRDYIRKEGKYLDSDKKETNLIDTFEEYGEMPLDVVTKNETISEQVFQLLENDCSISEIIRKFPSYATKISQLEKARQTILEERYRDTWRDVAVHYIYGETGTGKTRSVMEKYGYSNVYKITNYKNPFDNYKNEPVILFDEFHSSIPIGDMLQYLDGYPCRLPARFSDKTACYTTVYIISNIDLNKQYPNIQTESVSTWNAFVRRISTVKQFSKNDKLPFTSDNESAVIELLVDDYIK